MMPPDREMWTAALRLIGAYGRAALSEASKRAEQVRENGDAVETGLWLMVRRAAQEVLRPRGGGEPLH